jgi:nucleotide-binding universal stress UspA family protein
MTVFRRVLAATDLSDASVPVLELAIRVAKTSGAVLLIAHVYDEPHLAELSTAHVRLYSEYERKIREDADSKVGLLVGRAREAGVEAEALLLSGFADEAIVQAAQEKGADLVVMGTHGRRGVSHFFLGSVAARVVATSPCPVLTLRGPA